MGRDNIREIYHGTIAKAIMSHTNWPRIMLMYLGARDAMSAAKGATFVASEVPSALNAQTAEAKNTPARAADEYPLLSRIPWNRSYGFQYASPYMFLTAAC